MKISIVTSAILEENNKFLIVSPSCNLKKIAADWEFPGGTLPQGEDPEKGLMKIIKDELGIEITILDIFKVESHIVNDEQIIYITYLCIRNFGEPQKKECRDFYWASLDELRSGKFEFSVPDKKIINKISIFSGCGPSLIF